MDEDATWYRSRPRPRPHCIRRGPTSARNGHRAPPHLFGPCLLWPRSPTSATAELLLLYPRPFDVTEGIFAVLYVSVMGLTRFFYKTTVFFYIYNTMCPEPSPSCMPSFILIHPTVWPQYTNVTASQGRQDRQIGQTTDR